MKSTPLKRANGILNVKYNHIFFILLISFFSCKNDKKETQEIKLSIDFTLNGKKLENLGYDYKLEDLQIENGKYDDSKVLILTQGEELVIKDLTQPVEGVKTRQWYLDADRTPDEEDKSEIRHVFTEPGDYEIKLTINERETRKKLVKVLSIDEEDKYERPTPVESQKVEIGKINEEDGTVENISTQERTKEEHLIVSNHNVATTSSQDKTKQHTRSKPQIVTTPITTNKSSTIVKPITPITSENYNTSTRNTTTSTAYTTTPKSYNTNTNNTSRTIITPTPNPRPKPTITRTFFSRSTQIAEVGKSVVFTDRSEPVYLIKNRKWTFGDGTVKNGTNNTISHTYNKEGSYDVKLCLNDGSKCITLPVKVIKKKEELKTALFKVSQKKVKTGVTISFNDNSPLQDQITKRRWDFGNGITRTTYNQAINYTYNRPGKYKVRMCLNDTQVCQTETVVVEAKENRVITSVSFKVDKTSIKEGQTVNFTDYTSPLDLVKSRSWDFGDGTKKTGTKTITHTYNKAGVYTVKLCVNGTNKCSNVQRITVEKKGPPPITMATFRVSRKQINEGETIEFTDASLPNTSVTSRSWDFGDGSKGSGAKASHTYNKAGNYTVTLVLNDGVKKAVENIIVTPKLPEVKKEVKTKVTSTVTTKVPETTKPIKEKVEEKAKSVAKAARSTTVAPKNREATQSEIGFLELDENFVGRTPGQSGITISDRCSTKKWITTGSIGLEPTKKLVLSTAKIITNKGGEVEISIRYVGTDGKIHQGATTLFINEGINQVFFDDLDFTMLPNNYYKLTISPKSGVQLENSKECAAGKKGNNTLKIDYNNTYFLYDLKYKN